MDDPYEAHRHATVTAVLTGSGRTDPDLRRRLFDGSAPEALAGFVARVRSEPWAVTDEDWAPLRAAHPDEDAQFELVLASAVGAAHERIEAALRALEGA